MDIKLIDISIQSQEEAGLQKHRVPGALGLRLDGKLVLLFLAAFYTVLSELSRPVSLPVTEFYLYSGNMSISLGVSLRNPRTVFLQEGS